MVAVHRSPLALACAIALACPSAAAAAPPPNDHYLQSTRIVDEDERLPLEYADRVDTSEATTQPDLFQPDSRGRPRGGGDPEPTACPGGPPFGRTAWWDFAPLSAGRVELGASGRFDVVLAVYEWSEATSRITRLVACANAGTGSETLVLPEVARGRNYTVQAGGVGDAGGRLDLGFRFLPDTDGDGVLDERDRCDRARGRSGAAGCPPRLRAVPRLRVAPAAVGGVVVRRLAVARLPRGARAEVRCRRCGGRVARRARRAGTLVLRGFAGRTVPAGDRIELRVTRSGALGRYHRWRVTSSGIGDRTSRCLLPGSRTPRPCP